MEPFAQGPEAHVPAIHSGAGTDRGVVAKEKREGSGGRRVQRGRRRCWAAVVGVVRERRGEGGGGGGEWVR